ncbi:hypothetical protein J6590_016488 [Homalodisca vitripennis]|nr:hypothetical protein J6590_016488 [Homalodisca vitripennis]
MVYGFASSSLFIPFPYSRLSQNLGIDLICGDNKTVSPYYMLCLLITIAISPYDNCRSCY